MAVIIVILVVIAFLVGFAVVSDVRRRGRTSSGSPQQNIADSGFLSSLDNGTGTQHHHGHHGISGGHHHGGHHGGFGGGHHGGGHSGGFDGGGFSGGHH